MLTRLSIHNVVLIERCELEFAPGLSVLTGETGAGKSILLDALGLALGLRAESGLLRAGATQASVTAEFTLDDAPEAQALLKELDLETGETLILRRTLSMDGKSRGFVNDNSVSLNALRSLGDALLEVHGQHDQRGLLSARTHQDTLDRYGDLDAPRRVVGDAWRHWKATLAALDALRRELESIKQEQGYLQFMHTELSKMQPQPGEEESLSLQRTTMMQSEKLAEILQDVIRELNPQKPVASSLGVAERILSRSALNADGKFRPILEHLERAQAELQEAQSQLEKLSQHCTYDPQKLERMEERLFALRAAARKYNMPVEELPGLLAQVSAKLAAIDTQAEREAALAKQAEEAKTAYQKVAEKLSGKRKLAAKKLETAMLKELAPLKMESVGFRVAMEALPQEQWGVSGMDSARFEAATNKGSAFAPLHKIASGGELSRFMLALKVALSRVTSAPVMIFDEIDAGTGGAVADAIGARLALLGKTQQVFVVTHLPQVAAKGDMHLRVSKEEKKGATFTRVETLDKQGREEELARMLAGAQITAEARKAAQRLMKAG